MRFFPKTRFSWIVRTLFLVALMEGGLRFTGIHDFPIYQSDPEIGYIPAPHQSGNFLRHHDWIFNERSMGTGKFQPAPTGNWLLIGDSIVYGGNPYAQMEKLGPQLQEALGKSVRIWPVGAGSWGALNEMTYIDRNRDLISVMEGVVWVLNTGDFQERSQWSNRITHPRQRPWSALVHVVEKYIWAAKIEPKLIQRWPEQFPPPHVSSAPLDLHLPDYFEFLKTMTSENPRLRLLLVLYPTQVELDLQSAEPLEMMEKRLSEIARDLSCGFLSVRSDKRWNSSLYRDYIHPTPEGNKILGQILAECLRP